MKFDELIGNDEPTEEMITLYEAYRGIVKAGFTEEQSFKILMADFILQGIDMIINTSGEEDEE